MSACGSSFFVSCCCSISLFLYIYSRRFPATTLAYARKIGNPGPHYSTILFLFLSPFSRVRLASDPSYSDFSSPSISSWSNGLPAIFTKWRNRPFIIILTVDHLSTKPNFNRERCDDSRARRWIIRQIRKFRLFILNDLDILL